MSDIVTTEEPKAKPGPKPKKLPPGVTVVEDYAVPAGSGEGRHAVAVESVKTAPDRTPIPVKRIRLQYGQRMDLPGKEGAQALDDNRGNKNKAKRWAIDYLPWMRRVRVKHWNGDNAVVTVLIPEAWVMLEVEEG